MQAEKRHEVKALMSEVYKAAEGEKEGPAVAVLTREVQGLMRGVKGASAEYRAERVKKAVAVTYGLTKVAKGEALTAAQKAYVVLTAAVALGEPEPKAHVVAEEPAEEE